MNVMDIFQTEVIHRINSICKNQEKAIERAAQMMNNCIKKEGKIYFFGTGHSYIVGQEVFARAGGYAGFIPILQNELGMNHPYKSTLIERTESYADVIFGLYDFHKEDIMFITSNSGRNPLIVEVAQRAKHIGMNIVAITSLSHSQQCSSRHQSKLRLFEIADIVLDNQSNYGDASIVHDEKTKTGPTSTICNCFLIHLIVSTFVQMLVDEGAECPVFRSSNMDGADAFNERLFDLYKQS